MLCLFGFWRLIVVGGVWFRRHLDCECACRGSLLSLSLCAHVEGNIEVALHFLDINVQGGGFFIMGGTVSLVLCTISENIAVRSLLFLSFFSCTCVLSDSIYVYAPASNNFLTCIFSALTLSLFLFLRMLRIILKSRFFVSLMLFSFAFC